MKKSVKIFTLFMVTFFSVLFIGCDSWLQGKNFFDSVSEEVKYANAKEISVFVRYPDRNMGDVSPDKKSTQKVDIPFTITAVDSNAFGFYRWAAFSTKDFSTGRQYSDLTLGDTEADFIAKYGDKMLPDTEVLFDDPYSAATKVKIINERNDVFIMPICVERPYVVSTIPSDRATNVVKNSTITLVFSRPMNGSMIVNDDGGLNSDYIQIRRRTGSGESIRYSDISDYIGSVNVSMSGKTVSLKLSDDCTWEKLSVNVLVSRDLEDDLGYTMDSDYEFVFSAGSDEDGVPPTVEDVKIGYTELNETTDSESNSTTWKKNRVGKTANIWAYVTDKTKAGEIDGSEANVYELYYEASKGSLKQEGQLGYVTGEDDYNPDAASQGYGTGFNIDLSEYGTSGDGLWSVKIWATDTAGNEGDKTKKYYFVRDTQAPSVGNASKISASSTKAPYGWYNSKTLGQMQISGTNEIVDSPSNVLYRSEKVFWRFSGSNDTTGYKVTDKQWTEVSSVPKSMDELGVTLSGSDADDDGSLPLYVVFMDDVGNMSAASKLDSLKFDDVKPVLQPMFWTNAEGTKILSLANSGLLENQYLNIPFTESLSGVKIITVDVKSEDGSQTVANPLADSGLELYYVPNGSSSATKLSSSDYEISADKKTITLTNAKKSGTLRIKNLKVLESVGETDVTSVVTVTIKDTALNEALAGEVTIACDKNAPVINKAEIVDSEGNCYIKQRVLFEDATDKTYWLSHKVIDGTGNGKGNATKVPLKLTIKETGTGVETIKFTGDIVAQSSTGIKVGTKVLTKDTDFTVSSDGSTITFLDSSIPAVKGTSVEVYLTNLYAKKINGNDSGNALKITISDFAKGENTDRKTIDGPANTQIEKIYTDPWKSGINSSTLKDNGKKSDGTTAELITAESGYTNSKLVDLVVELGTEQPEAGISASGINAIKVLSGAKFTDKTTATLVEGGTVVAKESLEDGVFTFVQTFSKSNKIKFSNVELTATSDGPCSVGIASIDVCGWVSDTKSASITLDTQAPWWVGGENNPKSGVGPAVSHLRHENATDVYPRTSSYGVIIDETEKNKDGLNIRYFYTKHGREGQTGSWIALATLARDNICLQGYRTGGCTYILSGDESADNVVAKGTHDSTDLRGDGYVVDDKTVCNFPQWFGEGTSSIVIADAAGNYSLSCTVKVVEDKSGPADKLGSGNTVNDFIDFTYSDPTNADTEFWQVLTKKTGSKSYTNVFAYHNGSSVAGKRAQIDVDLSDYPEVTATKDSVPIEYYSIRDIDPLDEIGSSSVSWGKWLKLSDYLSADKKLTVYPYLTNDLGECYLYLKDMLGNVSKVPIRTREHAVENATESWERDGDVDNPWQGWNATGDISKPSSKPGTLVGRGNFNYYNDSAYTLFSAADTAHCILGSDASTKKGDYYEINPSYKEKNQFSRRFKIVLSKTELSSMTKEEVDTGKYSDDSENCQNGYVTKWVYGAARNNYNESSLEYVRVDYPENHTADYTYMYIAVEDGVGNFDVAPMSANGVNRWIYDGKGPKVYLLGDSEIFTQGEGADISKTDTLGQTVITDSNVQKFMSDHKGKHVYVEDYGVKFSSCTDGSGTSASFTAKNTKQSDSKRAFFNIGVQDDNGIDGWAYSLSNTLPSSWNTGSIAVDFPIDLFKSGDYVNERPENVYLFVKDYVGNVTRAKIGATKWCPDNNYPGAGNSSKSKKEFGEYVVNYTPNEEKYYNTSTLNIIVPSSGKVTLKKSVLVDELKIYNDSVLRKGDSYSASTYPSEIVGFSTSKGLYSSATENLELEFTGDPGEDGFIRKDIYVYDKTGNFFTVTLLGKRDETNPSVGSFSIKLNNGNSVMNSTVYYNSGTVKPNTYSDSDSGIYGYYIDSNSNGSVDKVAYTEASVADAFSINLDEANKSELYLHVIDWMRNVKNIRLSYSPVPFTPSYYYWCYDNEPPSPPESLVLVDQTQGTYDSTSKTITYDKTLSTIDVTPSSSSTDVKGYNTDGSINISSPLSINCSGNSGSVNIYAIDYAGNVSTPTVVKYVAADAHSYEKDLPATGYVKKGSVNYYKSYSVGLRYTGFMALKKWGIGTSNSTSSPNLIVSSTTDGTLDLPITLDSATSLYIYVESERKKEVVPLDVGGVNNWCYDGTAPSKPSVSITNADGKYTSSGNNYVYSSAASPSFDFSSMDSGVGLGGYYYTIDGGAEKSGSSAAISGSGTLKVYAKDKLGNKSSETTVTYSAVNVPGLTCTSSNTITELGGTYHFNDESVPSYSITINANGNGIDVTYDYGYTIGSSDPVTLGSDESAGVKNFSLSTIKESLSTAQEIKFWVKENMFGEKPSDKSIGSWCYDNDAPTNIALVKVSSSKFNVKKSGSTVYYPSGASVTVKISAEDDNLWCIGESFGATSNVSGGSATLSLTSPSGNKTFYAFDKAKNKSSGVTLTFVPVAAPTITSTPIDSSTPASSYVKTFGGVSYFKEGLKFKVEGNTPGSSNGIGYTYSGTSIADSTSPILTMPNFTTATPVTVTVTDELGQSASLSVANGAKWKKYVAPTGGTFAGTEDINTDYNDDSYESTTYTCTLNLGNVPLSSATLDTNGLTVVSGSTSQTNLTTSSVSFTVILADENGDFKKNGKITVTTQFGDTAVYTYGSSVTGAVANTFAGFHGGKIDTSIADLGLGTKPVAKIDAVQYFTTLQAGKMFVPEESMPKNFGEKVRGLENSVTPKTEKSVTSTVDDGSIDSGWEKISVIEEPDLDDHLWRPSQDAGEVVAKVMDSTAVSQSVQIFEATDAGHVPEQVTKNEKKSSSVVWIVLLGAFFLGVAGFFRQKSTRNAKNSEKKR